VLNHAPPAERYKAGVGNESDLGRAAMVRQAALSFRESIDLVEVVRIQNPNGSPILLFRGQVFSQQSE
jgi:hypothetical protein